MNPKFKFFLFVICLIALFVFQKKGVMPIIYDIISSDFFLEESADQASQIAISNEMTNFAFNHCNTSIANNLDTEFSVNFSEKPISAWSMGNYQYIINAKIEMVPTDAASFIKSYVCRINYTEKDNLLIADDIDNWSVIGLSGLDNL